MKPFLPSLLLVLCCHTLFGQITQEEATQMGLMPTINMQAVQQQQAGKKLPTFRQRWLWANESQRNALGTFPSAVTLQDSYQEVYLKRQQEQQAAQNATWLPIGPFSKATRTDPLIQQGVGRLNCLAFHPIEPNILFVGAPNGGIWKTTNHGESWQPLGDELPVPSVSDIAIDPSNPAIMYIATGDFEYYNGLLVPFGGSAGLVKSAGIFKTLDGGTTWESIALPIDSSTVLESLIRRILIHPANTAQLVVGGVQGIWTSNDGGMNWEHTLQEKIVDLKQDPLSPNRLYAVALNHQSRSLSIQIIRSTNFGKDWEVLETNIPTVPILRAELAIAPSNPATIYAVTVNDQEGLEGVYKSKDGGDTWEERFAGTTKNLLGLIDGNPADDIGGQGTYDLAIAVDPNDENKVVIGGINLWASEDGGASFDLSSLWLDFFGTNIHADQHQAKFHPTNGRFYVVNDGGIAFTENFQKGSSEAIENCIDPATQFPKPDCYVFPTRWQDISDNLAITEFYRLDVQVNNAQFLVAGAQDNAVFYRDPTGWKTLFSGDGKEVLLHPTDARLVYGGNSRNGTNGQLNRTIDGGTTSQTRLTAPILQAGAAANWVTPFLLNPKNPTTIYGGFDQLYRSTNAGIDWEQVGTIPNETTAIYAIAQSAVDTNVIAVAPSPFLGLSAAIYLTTDNGENWLDVSADLPIAANFITAIAFGNTTEELFITFAGYESDNKVFRTKDRGNTWENYSKDLPNIPVHCIAHQQGSDNNTLYIGTDTGIYCTSDESDQWTSYNQALPNVRVNDLSIHYGTQKIYAATYGRGIWVNDLLPTHTVANEPIAVYNTHVQVLPNPNWGQFKIQLTDVEPATLQLSIIDVLGRIHHQEEITVLNQSFSKDYSLRLTSGLYYLQLSDGNRSKVERFVVSDKL